MTESAQDHTSQPADATYAPLNAFTWVLNGSRAFDVPKRRNQKGGVSVQFVPDLGPPPPAPGPNPPRFALPSLSGQGGHRHHVRRQRFPHRSAGARLDSTGYDRPDRATVVSHAGPLKWVLYSRRWWFLLRWRPTDQEFKKIGQLADAGGFLYSLTFGMCDLI